MPKLFSGGLREGKEMTPMQRAGVALMSVQSPTMNAPMNGVAANIMAQNQARMEQKRVENEVQRLMLEMQRNPAHIRQMNASAALAETQADRQYQLDLEKQKMEYQKQLLLDQKRQEIEQISEIMKRRREAAAGGSGATPNQTPMPQNPRFRYVTTPESQSTPTAPVSEPTVPPQQSGAVEVPAYTPPPGSPAAVAMAKREEARKRIADDSARQTSERMDSQKAFDSEVASSDPLEFATKYQDKGHLLRPDQRMKLEEIMRRLVRTP
jgi:hypothetical protein